MYTRLISFDILLGRMEAGARTNPVSRREGGERDGLAHNCLDTGSNGA